MTNRNLLEEAIADAKAIKATAIANAKAALEESRKLRNDTEQKYSQLLVKVRKKNQKIGKLIQEIEDLKKTKQDRFKEM